MPLRLPVDTKALAVAYLKTHASVVAIAGSRISDRAKGVFPEVSIVSFGGREVMTAGGREVHLDETYLQVDCWGADFNAQQTTQLLARTVRAALLSMTTADHTRGVVTGVRTITPPMDFADELERSRVRAEYGVFTHPLPL